MDTMTVPQSRAGSRAPASEWAEAQTRLIESALERRVAERTRELETRWEREHRLAETLRRALLLTPPPASFPGLTVETFSEVAVPEALVGGDFCDAFALDADHTALVLGDVCGKGLVAALHIPEIKFMLRAFLSVDPSPARALRRLNERLCDEATPDGPPNLTALALVVIDGRTGRGVCALAGAVAPLLLRAGGGCEPVRASGVTLGADAGSAYATFPFGMGVGDLLLLATDGITEARCDGVFLDAEGMAGLAARAWEAAPAGPAAVKAVGSAVMDGARRFAGGPLSDDVCLLLAQRGPAAL